MHPRTATCNIYTDSAFKNVLFRTSSIVSCHIHCSMVPTVNFLPLPIFAVVILIFCSSLSNVYSYGIGLIECYRFL